MVVGQQTRNVSKLAVLGIALLFALPGVQAVVPDVPDVPDVLDLQAGTAGATGATSPTFGVAGTPAFDRYAVPSNVWSWDNSAEPTVGIYWDDNGPDPLYFKTLFGVGKAEWDDTVSPPTVQWEDWSRFIETASGVFADPILHTDEVTGRTWAGHFRLPTPCADMAFRDHDSSNLDTDLAGWTTMPAVCQVSAGDHETVGSGAWSKDIDVSAVATYGRAVYYCAQYPIVNSCTVSYDGGLTWPQITSRQVTDEFPLLACAGIHGHVRVSEDGYAAIPHRQCGSQAGFALSKNNGLTWAPRDVPGTGAIGHFDPSISFSRNADADGDYWTYFAVANPGAVLVAASDDYGLTWKNGGSAIDVGAFYTGPNGEKITRTEWVDRTSSTRFHPVR